MIPKVAPPTTDAASVAPPAAGDSADSGVFDVLLTLQSLASASASANSAAAAANAQQASSLEGADLLAGTLEDLDDSSDDASDPTDSAEGALWFLSTLLPASKISVPGGAADAAATAHFQKDAAQPGAAAQVGAQAGAPVGAQAGTVTELAKAFAFGPTTADAANPQVPAPNLQAAAMPVIDASGWSSLTGPAEFLAQSKQATVERAEAAQLATHVRDPRWVDDLGNRLASMVRTGESSASLQLTPVDLGPLEVNVSVRENQATVHFGASNAETRALLEASMPRLREMLAAQGFQLMDSSVSHGFARQARHEAAGTPRVDALGESPIVAVQPIHITGLLDLYA
jgi:flagellar hook-length control protein FliK